MLNINKVVIAGHVGGSVVIRYTSGGTVVLNLSVATNSSSKKDGKRTEYVEWHRVVVFGKLAELVKDWIKKGTAVYVEGHLSTRKWQDKEGNDRWTTEIVVAGYQGQLQVNNTKEAGSPLVSEAPKVSDSDVDSAVNQEFDEDIPF